MSQTTLYILYNADATVMGKLKYGYRKITCPTDAPPECAACEITHGGLSLKETPAWLAAKKELEAKGLRVVQWHRDEMSKELKEWFEKESLQYPTAIKQSGDGIFELVATKTELGECKGDAKAFVGLMGQKGVAA